VAWTVVMRDGRSSPVSTALWNVNAANASKLLVRADQSTRSGIDTPDLASPSAMPDRDCSGLGSVDATKTSRSVRTAGMKRHTISTVLATIAVVAIATARVMTMRADVAGVLTKARRANLRSCMRLALTKRRPSEPLVYRVFPVMCTTGCAVVGRFVPAGESAMSNQM
jgi:hypothetical protein